MSKKNDGAGLNSRLIRRPIQRWAPLFILPVFAAFCIGFVWPFLQGIYLSFCTFNIPKDAKWVGLTNYSKIWTDVSFWNAFKNTAFFAVVSILLINVLAFFIAYALTQKMRGSNLFRTVFFMPNLIGGVIYFDLSQTLMISQSNVITIFCALNLGAMDNGRILL